MAFIKTNLVGKLQRDDRLQFPNIEQPRPLGCFSLDTNRDYQNTAENFRYFRMPSRLPLNLNAGYGQAKSKPENREEKERLYPVLHFILNHQNEHLSKKPSSSNTKAVEGFDFIAFRGLLRVVMSTPYEAREDWCIQATRYKGNIYLCEKETDQKRHERCNQDDYQKRCCAYGLKFEQYCLSDSPYEEPITNVPVDECAEFHCVFKTQFPGMTLLYGAEIDGALSNNLVLNVENKDILSSLRFMELKCSLRPTNERQYQNFRRFKCRNWWCQCFLAGINDIMIGYRNESGFVDEIIHMETRCLPQLGANFWDPSQCANFLIKFLNMVKREMKNLDCPHTVYEFYFNPRSRAIGYRIYAGKSSNSFLPDWYVTVLENRFADVPKI
ncbi:decapping nuclease DXO homolog [Episyrphus balteatus]|uniref:decapping nuclease DXO homolog n=1 Tax=Episyrphus balteatus TaxID=286459 RepID=UPI0024858688|nr:decapping nuclease DXO homolog [Episyrphus balteatus]